MRVSGGVTERLGYERVMDVRDVEDLTPIRHEVARKQTVVCGHGDVRMVRRLSTDRGRCVRNQLAEIRAVANVEDRQYVAALSMPLNLLGLHRPGHEVTRGRARGGYQ